MEFTEGIWKRDHNSVYAEHPNKIIEGNIICEAPETWELSFEKWESNAKLIACAPEMIELLEEIKDQYYVTNERQAERMEKLKALIKKATE